MSLTRINTPQNEAIFGNRATAQTALSLLRVRPWLYCATLTERKGVLFSAILSSIQNALRGREIGTFDCYLVQQVRPGGNGTLPTYAVYHSNRGGHQGMRVPSEVGYEVLRSLSLLPATLEQCALEVRRCRHCGCTDADCRQCIARTGKPCYWVSTDVCSACVTIEPITPKGGIRQ